MEAYMAHVRSYSGALFQKLSQRNCSPPSTSYFARSTPLITQIAKLDAKDKMSTWSLDPMPTALVKATLPTVSSIMVDILNSSQTSFKTASVTPIFKKPSLDPKELNNYRPMSNLPFLNKILERAIANQLHQHMSIHELIIAESGCISILILTDLSAAFDTVSHPILLTRLSDYLGLTDSALSFFQSHLSGREQFVTHTVCPSSSAPVNHGVPQGSVLCPLLFNIYMLPLGKIIHRHILNFHSYADNTQHYISTKPSAHLPPQFLVNCLLEIKTGHHQIYSK